MLHRSCCTQNVKPFLRYFLLLRNFVKTRVCFHRFAVFLLHTQEAIYIQYDMILPINLLTRQGYGFGDKTKSARFFLIQQKMRK